MPPHQRQPPGPSGQRRWTATSTLAVLAVGVLLLLQETWIHRDLGGALGVHGALCRSLIPALLVGLTLTCRAPYGWILLALGGVTVSTLLVGDRASLEFFGRPLDFQQSSAAGQLWQIRDSVASLIGLDGLLHIVAASILPLVGYLLYRRSSAHPRSPGQPSPAPDSAPRRITRRRVGTVALLYAAAGLAWAWVSVPPGSRQKASVRAHGALLHHVLRARDLWASTGAATVSLPEDEPRRSIETILARKALLNRTPSPFFGLAKGRNVVLLQLEAFEQFLLDLEVPGGAVTPNLNRLAAGGLRWRGALNLTMGGRSSDAVFSTLTGLLPHPTHAVALDFFDQDWISLPNTLAARGYKTLSLSPFKAEFWNCARAHPRYGIQDMRFQGSYGPGETVGWGLGDEPFFAQAAAMLAAVPEPYLALHKSLSSHHPFADVPPRLADWPVGPITSSMLANYLRLTHYTDGAIGTFIARLQASGQLDRAIIVAYGDHNAGFSRQARAALSQLIGRDRSSRDSDRVLFVVAIPGEEEFVRAHRDEFSATFAALHDIGPTVLHLLGIPSPVGAFGTHLFVKPEQRDPLLLPDGTTCLHRGELVAMDRVRVDLDGRAKPGPLTLTATQRDRLLIQPEVARLLIESHGHEQVRALATADDARLRQLAARPCWYETSTAPTTNHATSLREFPVLGVPTGQFAQSIRHAALAAGIPPQYVARGGGITAGLRCTNSREALDASAAAGYQLIEVDLEFTRDGELVLLRDWQTALRSLFEVAPAAGGDDDAQGVPLTRAAFDAARSRHRLTHLALPDLIPWLDAHPGIDIVLDSHRDPLRALRHFSRRHPDHVRRCIAQIARVEDYGPARQLGFTRIILRIADATDTTAVAFAGSEPLYAVVMPVATALGTDLPDRLGAQHVFTYADPVDERIEWRQLRARGIDGVYTDSLGLGRDEGAALPSLPAWQTTRRGARALGFQLAPHIPPGRFVWEYGPELELLNPGDTARDLQIDLWDDLSHHVAEHRVQVAPHGAMRIWLRQLFPGEGGRARLLGGIVDGRQEVQAKVFWGIDVRSRTELSVATEAHTEHVIEGPATGLGGHSLTIINPFETTAKVTLTRTVDGVSAREELTIGPLGRRPRAWVVKPTQRQLRVAVLGDPVVTQPQRWDPQLRVMR